jgi:hypothetical protein
MRSSIVPPVCIQYQQKLLILSASLVVNKNC